MVSVKVFNSKTKRRFYQLLAVFFWLLVWSIAYRVIDNEILLASPLQVVGTMFGLIRTRVFWETIAFSSLRIFLGFILAFITGLILAILSYRLQLLRELISPMMKVIKSTPVASFIILALFWFDSKNLSTLITFLMVLPIIFSNILQGLKAADVKLLQLAKVFRLSTWKKIRAIYLPSVIPFLVAAISVGLGFGFKAGIAAEVIGIPAKSIGRQLYEAKLNLMTKEMLAWTVIIILISALFERAVMLLIRSLLHKDSGRTEKLEE